MTAFCITYPLAFFIYMKAPFFDAVPSSTKIDDLRQRQKKQIPKLGQNQT
jgi:hypothetical protein